VTKRRARNVPVVQNPMRGSGMAWCHECKNYKFGKHPDHIRDEEKYGKPPKAIETERQKDKIRRKGQRR
jgi:hypothetical protein